MLLPQINKQIVAELGLSEAIGLRSLYLLG